MNEYLAIPVVWNKAEETCFSPVAPRVLRKHLYDSEGEGDIGKEADKNIKGH